MGRPGRPLRRSARRDTSQRDEFHRMTSGEPSRSRRWRWRCFYSRASPPRRTPPKPKRSKMRPAHSRTAFLSGRSGSWSNFFPPFRRRPCSRKRFCYGPGRPSNWAGSPRPFRCSTRICPRRARWPTNTTTASGRRTTWVATTRRRPSRSRRSHATSPTPDCSSRPPTSKRSHASGCGISRGSWRCCKIPAARSGARPVIGPLTQLPRVASCSWPKRCLNNVCTLRLKRPSLQFPKRTCCPI